MRLRNFLSSLIFSIVFLVACTKPEEKFQGKWKEQGEHALIRNIEFFKNDKYLLETRIDNSVLQLPDKVDQFQEEYKITNDSIYIHGLKYKFEFLGDDKLVLTSEVDKDGQHKWILEKVK